MKILAPPLHPPPPTVLANLTQDPEYNARELTACFKKAKEINGNVEMPPGEWPVAPFTV